jgi:hypothetical protein
MNRLDCTSCGARVEVTAGFAKAKLRCDACGYYVPIPASLREEPVAASVGRAESAIPDGPLERSTQLPTSSPAKSKKEAPPLLRGTDDDEDGLPYQVPGDAIQKCTACHRDLPLDATFCVHCGVNFETKKKKKKRFQEVNKSWEPRWPFETRVQVLVGLQVLNVLIAIFFGNEIGIIQVLIQAFILGTYEKLTVTRTAKGVCTVEKIWRIGFYATPPKRLDHSASQGVGIIATQNAGWLEWFTMLYLCLFGLLPGLLFYWYIIRPDRFNVSLCDIYGSTNDIAFRTTDREQADEICRTISDCASMWYKPVM